jgi:hypothetical protein
VFARRFAPDFALLPFMGWLFRVRDAEGNLQMPEPLHRPKPAKKREPVEAAPSEQKRLSA